MKVRAADPSTLVIPAQAGIQRGSHCPCGTWIPAFAGMTKEGKMA